MPAKPALCPALCGLSSTQPPHVLQPAIQQNRGSTCQGFDPQGVPQGVPPPAQTGLRYTIAAPPSPRLWCLQYRTGSSLVQVCLPASGKDVRLRPHRVVSLMRWLLHNQVSDASLPLLLLHARGTCNKPQGPALTLCTCCSAAEQPHHGTETPLPGTDLCTAPQGSHGLHKFDLWNWCPQHLGHQSGRLLTII